MIKNQQFKNNCFIKKTYIISYFTLTSSLSLSVSPSIPLSLPLSLLLLLTLSLFLSIFDFQHYSTNLKQLSAMKLNIYEYFRPIKKKYLQQQ